MSKTDLIDPKVWQLKFKNNNFEPKFIFKNADSRNEILFSLSFFLMIMALEILFNQPFKKKIKIFHNHFYKRIFKNKYERLERIEINSFAYSLFLIFQKLFEEEEGLKSNINELLKYVITHWSFVDNLNHNNYLIRLKKITYLWDNNKQIVLSRTYESRIDLIFLLYKSFEIGVSDKKIIKKNLSVLIFSVSKAQKEFRYDVLRELKRTKYF